MSISWEQQGSSTDSAEMIHLTVDVFSAYEKVWVVESIIPPRFESSILVRIWVMIIKKNISEALN